MEDNGFKRKFGYFIAWVMAKFVTAFIYKTPTKAVSLGLDTPFIVVCNHQTDFDLAFMVANIKEKITPVASEHVLRQKITGHLVRNCLRPITVFKGSIKVSAVRQMIKAIRNGQNLMIHPEGARTFDGQTMEIGDEIGKVIKACKCALVTYNIKGGYIVCPRWGLHVRKGKVTGNIVNVFPADQIQEMTPEEIADIIRRDLYVNDYDVTKERNMKVRGKARALGIENFIYICPKCGSIGTLYGEGDYAICMKCGFQSEIDPHGIFDDDAGTLVAWGERQKRQFEEMYEKGDITFTDENVELRLVHQDHSREVLAKGTLTGTKEGISVGDIHFGFAEFEDNMEMIGRGIVGNFCIERVRYELEGEKRVNMYKYWMLYEKYHELADS